MRIQLPPLFHRISTASTTFPQLFHRFYTAIPEPFRMVNRVNKVSVYRYDYS